MIQFHNDLIIHTSNNRIDSEAGFEYREANDV